MKIEKKSENYCDSLMSLNELTARYNKLIGHDHDCANHADCVGGLKYNFETLDVLRDGTSVMKLDIAETREHPIATEEDFMFMREALVEVY